MLTNTMKRVKRDQFIGFKIKEDLLVTQPIEIEINIPNVVQTKKKVVNKKELTTNGFNT